MLSVENIPNVEVTEEERAAYLAAFKENNVVWKNDQDRDDAIEFCVM